MPKVTYTVDAVEVTELMAELRVSSKPHNHTPDVALKKLKLSLKAGAAQRVQLDFGAVVDEPRYAFVCLMANEKVSVHLSDQRLTGVLSVSQRFNRAVAKSPKQVPPPDSGIESFEFWLPERRPGGKNLAIELEPPLKLFRVQELTNGIGRPTRQPNAWVAAFEDEQPCLRLTWSKAQVISRVELTFDNDFDHPAESVLLGHPESVMPFCVPNVVVLDGRVVREQETHLPTQQAGNVNGFGASRFAAEFLRKGSADGNEGRPDKHHPPGLLAKLADNHQTLQVLTFERPVSTDCLEIHLTAPNGSVPAALFEVRCYAQASVKPEVSENEEHSCQSSKVDSGCSSVQSLPEESLS